MKLGTITSMNKEQSPVTPIDSLVIDPHVPWETYEGELWTSRQRPSLISP